MFPNILKKSWLLSKYILFLQSIEVDNMGHLLRLYVFSPYNFKIYKMKKLLFIGMIALTTCFALSSCAKVSDDEINKMEQACQEGNGAEAAKIYNEIKEKRATDEQAERIVTIALDCPEVWDAMMKDM